MRNWIVLLIALAPGLVAADDKPPEPVWVASVTATSTLAEKGDPYAAPYALVPKTSSDPKTDELTYVSAWCEGKADEGIGESITIKLARPTMIKKVGIRAGVWRSQALFEANNQITGLDIATDDGRKLAVKPTAKRDLVDVPLGGAPVSSLTVRITSVKKGKMNDTCISQIVLGAETAVGFDATAVAAYPVAMKEIWATLWTDTPRCDAKVLSKYVDFPFNYQHVENTKSDVDKLRFKKHAKSFANAAAWEAACKANKFLPGGMTLEASQIEVTEVGKLGIRFESMDTSQVMHVAWRGGKWRIITFD